ncbi:MAG: 16S rRNA (adenine(1518)-N(6)/adenine(1519)-N(6))-dimethyltransferase RsmA [Tenacibaculum sp.]
MNIRAKKHLGQHFLTDDNIAKKIANTLTENTYDNVLEIGPGMGILTKHLLKKKSKITVVELDAESVNYLKEIFPLKHINLNTSAEKFSVIHADFLKHNLSATFADKQVAITGNFPYNISTQIVFKTLENRKIIPEFSGMFQQEVAKRITEKKGSKNYGIISVLVQAFYHAEYLFTVPPTVFNPPPKVYSGVIKLTRKQSYQLPVNEKLFFKVVKTSFNQRRKMLRGSLKSLKISHSLAQDPIFAMRPEQLSVQDFINLTIKIANHGVKNY